MPSFWDDSEPDLFTEATRQRTADNPFGVDTIFAPKSPMPTPMGPEPSMGSQMAPATPTSFTETGGVTGWGQDQPLKPAPTPQAAPTPQTPQTPQASDPVSADKIARDTYRTLKDAGHDVKWVGNQIQVDGRLYDVAGGALVSDWTSAGGLPTMPQTPAAAPPSAPAAEPTTAGTGGPSVPVPQASGSPTDPAYVRQKITEGFQQAYGRPPSDQEMSYWMGKALTPDVFSDGKTRVGWNDYWMARLTSPGSSSADVRLAGDETVIAGAPQQAGPSSTGGLDLSSLLSGATSPTQPGPTYTPTPSQAPPIQSWAPTAPAYTPGDLSMEDIPDFSYESLLQQLQQPSATETQADDFMASYLANPYSLDDRTVETMKAKSKDELAAQQLLNEDELTSFGNAMGIADSGWMGAQKAGGREATRASMIGKNRDIDLQAATTRGAEKQTAASMGAAYAGQKASQRQTAVTAAASAALAKASAVGTRQALQESMKQAAASLGMSADALTQSYVIAQMNDLTQRYGIDQNTANEMARLAQSDKQFALDLAFRLHALETSAALSRDQMRQQDDQFGADYGLNLAQFQWLMEQDARNRTNGETA